MEPKSQRKYLLVTPRPAAFRVELGGISDTLARALLARVEGRPQPILEKKDEEFLAGVASVFGLRYGTDVLNAVQNTGHVHIEVVVGE